MFMVNWIITESNYLLNTEIILSTQSDEISRSVNAKHIQNLWGVLMGGHNQYIILKERQTVSFHILSYL